MAETITFDSIMKAIPQLKREQKIELQKILHQEISNLREEIEENITIEELDASEKAWQDYKGRKDQGISSEKLKKKLFG